MTEWQEVEYTVLLVVPGYGTERENAEAIVENALEWLNANKIEPGFRFAPPVSAHLEIVSDADEVRERIESEESIAMVLLLDLDEDERDALLWDLQARHISACITVDVPRPERPKKGPWQITLGKKPVDKPSAHQLAAETLTGSLDEDDVDERVGEAIAVLALGVMQHHWKKSPPPTRFAP